MPPVMEKFKPRGLPIAITVGPDNIIRLDLAGQPKVRQVVFIDLQQGQIPRSVMITSAV